MNRVQLAGAAGLLGVIVIAVVVTTVTGPAGSQGAGPADDPSTVDIDEGDELELLATENVTVIGTVDAAPGSDVTVRLRASAENPYLKSQAATVDDDGRFEAGFDLSDVETDHEATLSVRVGDEEIRRTLLIQVP